MSHRREAKAQARQAREAAEQQRAADARRRRLWILGAIVAACLAAVVVIVVVSGGDDEGSDKPDKAETSALLRGIPQQGTSLGDPKAPVVLTEFADLQCPFCRDYAVNVLPELIDRYVRPGRMRLELRLLRFLGPDSVRGARAAYAAAEKNRLWNFVDAFYRNQGPENTGYATDDFLTELAGEAGLPAEALISAAAEENFERELQDVQAQADAAGIESTPSFLVKAKGGAERLVEVDALTVEAFEQALEPELQP